MKVLYARGAHNGWRDDVTIYKQGSSGSGVIAIQKALTAKGYDPGSVDGVFGAKTAAAARAFQRDAKLIVDGAVGPLTAAALGIRSQAPAAAAPPPKPTPKPVAAPTAPAAPASATGMAAKPLRERCVALTGSFETSSPVPQCFSGLTGNFDGQGMSFGALQWNFGQGSLQPLLQKMVANHQTVIAGIFGADFAELRRMLAMTLKADQVAWAAGIQTAKFSVNQPWRGYFVALGQTAEYQAIQADAAAAVYAKGLGFCRQFRLKSERAAALMFDIVTQNGSINAAVTAQINADFARLPADQTDETPKLAIVANRRAEASNPKWVENVRARKLVIANGRGTANGMTYDLAKSYAITLDPAADLT